MLYRYSCLMGSGLLRWVSLDGVDGAGAADSLRLLNMLDNAVFESLLRNRFDFTVCAELAAEFARVSGAEDAAAALLVMAPICPFEFAWRSSVRQLRACNE